MFDGQLFAILPGVDEIKGRRIDWSRCTQKNVSNRNKCYIIKRRLIRFNVIAYKKGGQWRRSAPGTEREAGVIGKKSGMNKTKCIPISNWQMFIWLGFSFRVPCAWRVVALSFALPRNKYILAGPSRFFLSPRSRASCFHLKFNIELQTSFSSTGCDLAVFFLKLQRTTLGSTYCKKRILLNVRNSDAGTRTRRKHESN